MKPSKYNVINKNRLIIPRTALEQKQALELNQGNFTTNFVELYQIQATRDIHTKRGLIPKGTLGGFVHNGYNLNPFDESWIEAGSAAMQRAIITDDSYIGKNVICRLAFKTPPNSDIESDHLIIVDHIGVYSTKHKAIVQYVGQDDALEKYLANREQMDQEVYEWVQAVKMINDVLRY